MPFPPPPPPDLVDPAPESAAIVSILALSAVRALTPTVASQIARIDGFGPFVDVGKGPIVVSVHILRGEALSRLAVHMGLVVCVPVVVRHERLVPDGVASVGGVAPVARTRVRDTDRVAPAELEREVQDLFNVGREPHGPRLRDRVPDGNGLGAGIAVEAVADLLPRLVPVAPFVRVVPVLPLSAADADVVARGHTASSSSRRRRRRSGRCAGLMLNTGHRMPRPDCSKLLARVLVHMDFGGAVGVGDFRDDVCARSSQGFANRIMAVVGAADKGSIYSQTRLVSTEDEGRGGADCGGHGEESKALQHFERGGQQMLKVLKLC